jgi:K+-transporting ATPase ATPase C chain
VGRHLGTAVRLFLLLFVLVGIAYPALVTGVAEWAFPSQASGDLVRWQGRVVGSAEIAQPFTAPRFFWGRPSATGDNPVASGASNYGPTNPALLREVEANLARFRRAAGPIPASAVPIDAVTSSASGVDPDISVAAALLQVNRVARANHLPPAAVRRLVWRTATGRWLGLYGWPHVNVLRLNLALLRLVAREREARHA